MLALHAWTWKKVKRALERLQLLSMIKNRPTWRPIITIIVIIIIIVIILFIFLT